MTQANFMGATIRNSSFDNATLNTAQFQTTDSKLTSLINVGFTRAKLQGATFRNSNLRDTSLMIAHVSTSTNFTNTELSGSTWIDGSRCADGSVGSCRDSLRVARALRRMVELEDKVLAIRPNWGGMPNTLPSGSSVVLGLIADGTVIAWPVDRPKDNAELILVQGRRTAAVGNQFPWPNFGEGSWDSSQVPILKMYRIDPLAVDLVVQINGTLQLVCKKPNCITWGQYNPSVINMMWSKISGSGTVSSIGLGPNSLKEGDNNQQVVAAFAALKNEVEHIPTKPRPKTTVPAGAWRNVLDKMVAVDKLDETRWSVQREGSRCVARRGTGARFSLHEVGFVQQSNAIRVDCTGGASCIQSEDGRGRPLPDSSTVTLSNPSAPVAQLRAALLAARTACNGL